MGEWCEGFSHVHNNHSFLGFVPLTHCLLNLAHVFSHCTYQNENLECKFPFLFNFPLTYPRSNTSENLWDRQFTVLGRLRDFFFAFDLEEFCRLIIWRNCVHSAGFQNAFRCLRPGLVKVALYVKNFFRKEAKVLSVCLLRHLNIECMRLFFSWDQFCTFSCLHVVPLVAYPKTPNSNDGWHFN